MTKNAKHVTKAHVAALAANIDAVEPQAVKPKQASFGVPREVRDLIYEECLTYPDTLQFSREAQWKAKFDGKPIFRGLAMPLPLVNSTVREEALEVLFGRNTWEISIGLICRNGRTMIKGVSGDNGGDNPNMRYIIEDWSANMLLEPYGHLLRCVKLVWYDRGMQLDAKAAAAFTFRVASQGSSKVMTAFCTAPAKVKGLLLRLA